MMPVSHKNIKVIDNHVVNGGDEHTAIAKIKPAAIYAIYPIEKREIFMNLSMIYALQDTR